MKASTVCFPAAVLMVIVGMGWGITMAISQNHETMPAHAHLNLLGWVSLFLMGIFYRLHPTTDRSRLALLQVIVWIIGTITLVAGVGIIYSGNPETGEPFATAGSLIVLAAMILFGFLVLRGEKNGAAAMVAAE